MSPVPLDEFPIHQVPLSLQFVGTSDRNFYDRSYLNAHDRTGDVFLITGFGVYPNLGVKDAYALVRRGNRQHAVRFSGAIDDNRLDQRVDPSVWLGTRDRSWGIRPVGEAEPQGRAATIDGFWWLYVPMRFDDFAVIVIVQEQPDGFRILNDATRVWADGRKEQLGWPEVHIRYRSGTRHPEHATIHLTERGGKPVTLEVTTLGFVPLHVGAGYGGDPDWTHGQWRGEKFAEGKVYDLDDPDIVARTPFGVIDHVPRATCDGAEGWGMFGHGTFGRPDPSGLDDWGSVAP